MKYLAKEISNGFHFDPFPHFSPLSPHLYRHEKTRKTAYLSHFPGIHAIGVTGFEPTTPSSLTKCASQLRYTPIFN